MKKLLSLFHKNHATEPNLSRLSHFWHEIGRDPFVDWVLILSLSVLVAVVLVAVGAYVYVDGTTKLSSAPPISASESLISHFDALELSRLINAFDARAAETVLLGKAYSGPGDPSLP